MRLRKTANMTQQELAEKLGYSDKSVSKWEQGNGLPDIRTLAQIASLFNVTVDDLIHERPDRAIMPAKTRFLRRMIIMLCAVALCWLVAVLVYVVGGVVFPKEKLCMPFPSRRSSCSSSAVSGRISGRGSSPFPSSSGRLSPASISPSIRSCPMRGFGSSFSSGCPYSSSPSSSSSGGSG